MVMWHSKCNLVKSNDVLNLFRFIQCDKIGFKSFLSLSKALISGEGWLSGGHCPTGTIIRVRFSFAIVLGDCPGEGGDLPGAIVRLPIYTVVDYWNTVRMFIDFCFTGICFSTVVFVNDSVWCIRIQFGRLFSVANFKYSMSKYTNIR